MWYIISMKKAIKSSTIRARVEPALKEQAERILSELGLNATEAITLFYRQVALHKGLPFIVRLPEPHQVHYADVAQSSASERKQLMDELSFPYDWSNPDLGEDVLIRLILKRGIFQDILEACRHFGYGRVQEIASGMDDNSRVLRSLQNIKEGMRRAQSGRKA